MEITINKLTSVDLLRKAASITIGKPSNITLKRSYALGHSLMRTQLFWVEMRQIPLSVAIHLCRHIHAQPYQLSKRTDRGGEDMGKICEAVSHDLCNIYDALTQGEYLDPLAILGNARAIEELPLRFGRNSPTDIGLLLNAEEIVNISRVRLCAKASADTQKVWRMVIVALRECDPDLYVFCVPNCIHQGFCRERPTCGYCNSEIFRQAREDYLKNFK